MNLLSACAPMSMSHMLRSASGGRPSKVGVPRNPSIVDTKPSYGFGRRVEKGGTEEETEEIDPVLQVQALMNNCIATAYLWHICIQGQFTRANFKVGNSLSGTREQCKKLSRV